MLTKPPISDHMIIACLHDHYGLRISQVTFLPIGADINSAVYRVHGVDGRPYFLKLRQGDFDEIAVTVPAFLRSQGIRRVMAPLATPTHRLWVSAHGFDWMLYPFVEGNNGFEVALSNAQWIALGETVKAIHTTALPVELDRRVPREDYSPRWRNMVKVFDQQVENGACLDPIAGRFAAWWLTKRAEIQTIIERAERLGQALQNRAGEFVVCHADLHAWNVMLGTGDDLYIVDWDNPIMAPRERDLMFVGGGVGGIWNNPEEAALFYGGYGPIRIDPVAIAYYRYERIVADIAAYSQEIFGVQGSVEDREEGLKQLMGQFVPNTVVDIAHRSYSLVP